MKVTVEKTVAAVAAEPVVHPLLKSHMLVSKRHLDYNNLEAFEAISMTAVFVLAIAVGVLTSSNILS